MERINYVTLDIRWKDELSASFTVAIYKDTAPNFIMPLGKGRFSLNIHRLSLIIELWFIR